MSTATNALALGVAAAAVWVAAKRAQAMKRGSAEKGYRIVCRPDTYMVGESSARYVAEMIKQIGVKQAKIFMILLLKKDFKKNQEKTEPLLRLAPHIKIEIFKYI